MVGGNSRRREWLEQKVKGQKAVSLFEEQLGRDSGRFHWKEIKARLRGCN